MNNPYPNREAPDYVAEYGIEIDEFVRRNPAVALLAALGVGLALGVAANALRPEPSPKRRAARWLDDLEDRLHDATAPLLRRGSALTNDAVDAALESRDCAEGVIADATRRLRQLFS